MQDDESYMRLILNRNWLAAFLLSILLFVVYSNSFYCSMHFDDKPNIISNKNIHINNLKLDSITKAFFKKQQNGNEVANKLHRPFSCLTLGLNWYVGKTDVFGYNVVNFLIHVATAILLFLVILKLFQTPNLYEFNKNKAYFIALLSATLWAIHPIQVQAVTFIVQRMTSLAAMFTLLGIFFYLKGRLSHRKKGTIFYCSAFIAFIFAIASKENAALFPVAILLTEWTFFNELRNKFSKKVLFICFVLFFCIVALLGISISGKSDLLFFLDGYENRAFTLTERLLTEPRIIIFYLSQIAYPVTTRLSITHDVNLSTSLINPWTTIPSILIILVIICFAFTQIRKRPWLGFPILFYFLYHLIESTVIPLEIIFEHRNYLPSMFLFLPVSIGFYKLLMYYKNNNKIMYCILSGFLCFLIIVIGLGTYSRNLDWRTNETLWKDAVQKAPNMARPLQNLGTFYQKHGKYDRSLELNKRALGLYDPKPLYAEHLSYSNIAVNYLKKGKYQKAILFLQKALKLKPTAETRYYLCIGLTGVGLFDRAEKEIEKVLTQSQLPKYVNFQSLIAFKTHKLKMIEKNCQQTLNRNNKDRKAYYYLGLVGMLKKEWLQADYFLATSQSLKPNDIVVLFSRVENSVKAGDKIETQPIVKELLSRYTLPYIHKMLDKINNDPISPPVSRQIVLAALKKEMKSYVER